MKINNLPLFIANNSIKNSQTTLSVPQQETSFDRLNDSKSVSMPMMAPNYMTKINFKAKLDWDEIDLFTKLMGKRIYSKRNVTALSDIHDTSNGITKGRGLPEEWTSRIKDMDNFDKDSFIVDFGKIVAKEREYADVDRFQNDLSDLFKKHKIIDDNTPFSVKYIGHGFQAWAYKIQIGDDENSGVVAKLFKRKNNYLQNHGNHTEQNLAEYVKKYAGDESEFTKYYFGDTKNGLMVVDYISPTQRPTRTLDLSDIGIGYGDDFPKNRINGIICDFGGIETVCNLMGNKTAQDVHKLIKYANTDEEKVRLFNEILNERDDSDEFKDKAIGLVHSIKHLPEELQPGLYKKCSELGSHRVNIALIQTIKYSSKFRELNPMIENLIMNSEDQKELEAIAKEIKHMPEIPRHRFFEKQTDTNVSAIIKYLGRNINQYYKDMPNRRHIYETFIENSDTYAGIALINSMHYMSSSRYDEYFEKFFDKKDQIINTTLARSLELLGKDSKVQEKWINKLLECKDVRVSTGLCESIPFINEELREPLFVKLLSVKDKVAKEFLSANITSVPGHAQHPEWIEQLLDGADNMVRGSLVFTIKNMNDARTKEQWKKIVLNGADDTIKQMVAEHLN